MKDQIASLLFLTNLFIGLHLGAQIDIVRIDSQNDWNFITDQAESQNLPIAVFICDPFESICDSFEKLVRTDDTLQDYLSPRFIQTHITSNTYFGDQFVYQYGIEFIPAVIVFNSQGIALSRKMGMVDNRSWLAFFKEGRKRAANYTQLMESWEKRKLTKEGFCACAEIFNLNLRMDDSFEAGFECVNRLSPANYLDIEYRSLILKYGLDLELATVPYFAKNQEYLKSQDSTFPYQSFLIDAYQHNLEIAILLNDSVRVKYLVEYLLPAINDKDAVLDSNATLGLFYESTDNWNNWGAHIENLVGKDSFPSLKFRELLDPIRMEHKGDTAFLDWLIDFSFQSTVLDDYNVKYLMAWAYFYSKDLKKAETLVSEASELTGNPDQRAETRQLSLRIRFALRQK